MRQIMQCGAAEVKSGDALDENPEGQGG